MAAALICVAGMVAQTPLTLPESSRPAVLIVGFLGGRVHADNMVHREASLGRDLQQKYGATVRVFTFANHTGDLPLRSVLKELDSNRDGRLSSEEKQAARILIYGHSWGASETVHLAQLLYREGVPVLLTVQVDSVRKTGENDAIIPPNVSEAMNFYQSDGMLHGRSTIRAADPTRTRILGNERVSYRDKAVDIRAYPWFARTFMTNHIEIENDPAVWNRVEELIESRIEQR